jgi:hypothetical protein
MLKTEMRLKFLIALLVTVLCGGNATAAAMCASYCDSSKSAQNAAAHRRHEMGSPANNKKSHIQSHEMHCTECPRRSGLSKSSDCNRSVEGQAIQENTLFQNRPNGNAPSHAATELVGIQEPTGNPEWQLRLDTSESVRDSCSRRAPLRI